MGYIQYFSKGRDSKYANLGGKITWENKRKGMETTTNLFQASKVSASTYTPGKWHSKKIGNKRILTCIAKD